MEIKLSKKSKLKKILDFLLNPKLLLCLFIAWMITNGWSYLFIAFGTLYNINWMLAFGSAYFAFLWFPLNMEGYNKYFFPLKIYTRILLL